MKGLGAHWLGSRHYVGMGYPDGSVQVIGPTSRPDAHRRMVSEITAGRGPVAIAEGTEFGAIPMLKILADLGTREDPWVIL